MGLLWSDTADEELNDERMKVTYHEAGHIIACHKFRIPYSDVTVSVSRTYWTGQLRSGGHIRLPENAFYQYDRTDLAVVALAGPAVEATYYANEYGWCWNKAWREAENYAGIDFSNAEACVGRRGIGAIERKARYLVESQWLAVRRLAATL